MKRAGLYLGISSPIYLLVVKHAISNSYFQIWNIVTISLFEISNWLFTYVVQLTTYNKIRYYDFILGTKSIFTRNCFVVLKLETFGWGLFSNFVKTKNEFDFSTQCDQMLE